MISKVLYLLKLQMGFNVKATISKLKYID